MAVCQMAQMQLGGRPRIVYGVASVVVGVFRG